MRAFRKLQAGLLTAAVLASPVAAVGLAAGAPAGKAPPTFRNPIIPGFAPDP